MNIPIVVSPYRDELLISWIYRLMRTNCLSKIEDFEKHVIGCRTRGDGFFNVTGLVDAIGVPELTAGRMLMHHTMYPEFCARTSAAEHDHVLGLMTGKGERLTYTKSLAYCPKCVKEAEAVCGHPVVYRFHQAVRVCPVHRVPLRQCSIRRWRYESYWVLDDTDIRPLEWGYAGDAFDLDCKLAEFTRDFIHLGLSLSRGRMEHIIISYLKGNGVDCNDVNDIQGFLAQAGYASWFCLQAAGNILDGLPRLTGQMLLRTAFAVFGSAGEFEKAFYQLYPVKAGTAVRGQLPANTTSCMYCGCGVFEVHTADGQVFLTRKDYQGE